MKKEFLTIAEVAKILKCTEVNVYHHIRKSNLKTVEKAVHIQTSSGTFVPTGERKEYIVSSSIKEMKKKGRQHKGKAIKAEYIDGVDKTFENGKRTIIFASETIAAKTLKIGKFALRYRLQKKTLVGGEIAVSVA